MRRPNILLFMADQLRADHLGCYGNTVVRTPHIDSLAARGVSADDFHVASTLCMPNRATLLTGRMPSLHGVRRNGIPLPLNERTFVENLRASGYRTALIGKAHFQPFGSFGGGDPAAALRTDARRIPGNREDYENEWIDLWREDASHHAMTPYYGFEHAELCLYHGDLVEGDYVSWLKAKAPALAAQRGPEHALPGAHRSCRDAWRTRVPAELYPSAFIAERTRAWLTQHVREEREKPFFVMCSFPDPHHPFTPPGKYWDMYDPATVSLPASFHARSHSAFMEFIHGLGPGKAANSHMPFAPTEQEAREIIALTLGSISNIDDCIGSVLRTLQQSGLEDDTVVAFTSDHGDLMGDHGAMLKGPMHFRGLTRVPFIWADPARPQRAGQRLQQVRGTLDIARTILDAAGSTPWAGMQGKSLLSDFEQTQSALPGVCLVENESAGLLFGRPHPFKMRSLVTANHRLSYSTDPELCELYDLHADPYEQHNRWNDADHAATRNRLLMQLLDTMALHAEQGLSAWSAG